MKLPSDPVTVNGEQAADTIAVQTMRGEKVQRASSRKPGNLLDQETDGYLPQKEPCLKLSHTVGSFSSLLSMESRLFVF